MTAGGLPIVVDRGSLVGAGWGPRTPLVPRRSDLVGRTAEATFADLGLTISDRGGVAVVSVGPTTLGVDDAELAAYEGRDRIDNAQSVPRWRGEPTPMSGTDRSLSASEPATLTMNVHTFAASGWPGVEASARLVDSRARWILTTGLVASLGLIALISCKIAWVWRSILMGGVVALGVIASIGLVRLPPGFVWGLLLGAGVAAGVWFGEAVGTKGRPRLGGSRTGRPRTIGTIAGVLALIATGLAQAGPDEATPQDPIIALLPYQLPFDPSAPADSVILRLSDHNRLRELADLQPAQTDTGSQLTASLHEVRREGAADARVASAYDILLEGPGTVAWPIPIGAARDLSANLDGRDVPIRLGSTATVEIAGEGTHRLILRRLVALDQTVGGDSLRLPVPPLATARLRVVESNANPSIDALNARGRTTREDGLLSADLGPVANLELRWRTPSPKAPRIRRGSVQALVLWDIEPAGDRVRIHLTPKSPESLDRLVLNLGTGLRVRSVDRPGAEGITKATADGTTWVLPFETPLTAGENLRLELWRPGGDVPSPGVRRFPRIDFGDLAEVSVQVGVRKPADWQGRIQPADGAEVVADDVFARAWGMLPDTGATFSGAVKPLDTTKLDALIGPSTDRPRVRPSVQLELVPGRLDVRASFEILDGASRPREWTFTIPPDLRVVRVEAPGLTDWGKVGTDRLRLRFDAEPLVAGVVIRIDGAVSVEEDPMSPQPADSEAATPWLVPLGVELAQGTLTINAAARLDPAPGVSPVTENPKSAQARFEVTPGSIPGRLRWKAKIPGLNVRVQSLVTLHPSTAEWVASARYSIPYGPCPPIGLRLPSAWADGAVVEVGGIAITPESTTDGPITTWILRPKRVPWGGVRVLIRSSRVRPAGAALEFPDLIPLGRPTVDRVESLLGLADAQDQPTAVEGSSGLQEVDASRWDTADSPWPPAAGRRVYRVVREGWTLRVLAPIITGGPTREAVIRLADLTCSLADDGVLIGRACYELDGRRASTLVITLPDGAEAMASDVDGTPVVPRVGGQGRVIVPLPEGTANRVVFCWRASPAPPDASGRHDMILPWVPGRRIPTLLSISGSDEIEIDAVGETRDSLLVDLEATRAEAEARGIMDQVATLDRGSPRESANLLASLIRFELQARTVERTVRGPGLYGTPRASSALGRLASTRENIQDALAASGLDAFGRSAAARVGRDTPEPLPGQSATVEAPAPLRVRPVGRVRPFRDDSGRPSVRWTPRKVDPSRAWFRTASLAMLGLSLIGLAFVVRRPRVATLGLATVVALVGGILGLGPAILAAIAAGVVLGLSAMRGRPRIDPVRLGD